MEEGFEAEDDAAADDDVAVQRPLDIKADPDEASKPSRKRVRDAVDWGADAEPDTVTAARARNGRVSADSENPDTPFAFLGLRTAGAAASLQLMARLWVGRHYACLITRASDDSDPCYGAGP
jgi:hypothetical protein